MCISVLFRQARRCEKDGGNGRYTCHGQTIRSLEEEEEEKKRRTSETVGAKAGYLDENRVEKG